MSKRAGRMVVMATHELVETMLLGVPGSVYSTNAPRDLRIIGVLETRLDQEFGQLRFVCESCEWEQRPEGSMLPEFILEVTRP